ncbi:hypothetical protein B0H16DRAFT_1739412 [Mycena metata]|uniref:Uncharacterized protein n=1 Tax=Mycena metata TaxID=1033252 RepID=A0AAD7HF59_9AGAR|nr:hypothetical protein B0H16DRAFT_1739412 [Mycena metata]
MYLSLLINIASPPKQYTLTLRLGGVVSSLAVGPILPDVSRGSRRVLRFPMCPAGPDPTLASLGPVAWAPSSSPGPDHNSINKLTCLGPVSILPLMTSWPTFDSPRLWSRSVPSGYGSVASYVQYLNDESEPSSPVPSEKKLSPDVIPMTVAIPVYLLDGEHHSSDSDSLYADAPECTVSYYPQLADDATLNYSLEYLPEEPARANPIAMESEPALPSGRVERDTEEAEPESVHLSKPIVALEGGDPLSRNSFPHCSPTPPILMFKPLAPFFAAHPVDTVLPEFFDGNNPVAIKPFLARCFTIFASCPFELRTDDDKITFILSHMTGKAAELFNTERLPDLLWHGDLTVFINKFLEIFGMHDEVTDVKDHLSAVEVRFSLNGVAVAIALVVFLHGPSQGGGYSQE